MNDDVGYSFSLSLSPFDQLRLSDFVNQESEYARFADTLTNSSVSMM